MFRINNEGFPKKDGTAAQIHMHTGALQYCTSTAACLHNASARTKTECADINTGTNFILRILLGEAHITDKHLIG